VLFERFLRALNLEASLYRELKSDRGVEAQGFLVVVVAALAGELPGHLPVQMGVLAARIGWALSVWSLLDLAVYWVGTHFLGGDATYWEVLRCLGFAYAPAALVGLAFVPVAGQALAVGSSIWSFLATVLAVREALGVPTMRAVGTTIAGLAIVLLVSFSLSDHGLSISGGQG